MSRILLLLICTLLLSSVSAQNEPKEKKQSKFGSFIRRVGESATGNVTVVIGATTEHKEASLSLGSDNYKLEAFDKSGNKYISTNGGGPVGEKFSKDLPKTFTYYFTDMGDLESIYLLRVGFYAIGGDLRLGSNMAGINPVVIKNIPIIWK